MWPSSMKKRIRLPALPSTSAIGVVVLILLLLLAGGAFVPGRWIRSRSSAAEMNPIIFIGDQNLISNHTISSRSPPPQSFPLNPAPERVPAPVDETNPVTIYHATPPQSSEEVPAPTLNESNPIIIPETLNSTNPIVQIEPASIQPTEAPPPPPAISAFACPAGDQTVCPSSSSSQYSSPEPATQPIPEPSSCPDYFRWIHEDLRPWKHTGITREMVERAQRTANFRLVVIGGKAYVRRYGRSYQTRDVFTIWGILQLLRRYPGRVPDLDLMFDCVDWPVVRRRGAEEAPPPLFRYCGDDATLDIVFPDWSFWGWAEINIKPWEHLREEMKEGNQKVKWIDREPYAYWKGNPAVAIQRQELLRCNVSEGHDWNARLYAQDWFKEGREGFKESNLANQCKHRYKIYIEGSAWSVSEKYILACDSMMLLVTPRYYDFFTRGLMPVQHYWPVRETDKCRSIKFAVDWGNSHRQKAQEIGKEGSNFILEKLKMEYVYDYMFHLLSEYAELLRYKPTVPQGAEELCAESMACPASGLEKRFMIDSLANSSRGWRPCTMPPPYSKLELQQLARKKANAIKQVEIWEERAGKSLKNEVPASPSQRT